MSLISSKSWAATTKWTSSRCSRRLPNTGIDLASLGPRFQSARLHDAAKIIINDFALLEKNGADVGGVLHGMAGAISKLVSDSLKFEVDIPRNMQPWIELSEQRRMLPKAIRDAVLAA